jgi:AraC-like DNA-binding protein
MSLYLSLLSIALALIVLAFNWKVNRNALFLSLLMILIASCQIRQYLVLYATEPFWLAVMINNPGPLWSMIGPCLFFYVRSVLTDTLVFRKTDWLHTLPFWVSLAGILPYWLTPFSYKLVVANLFIHHMAAVKDIRFNWMMSHEIHLLARNSIQIAYSLVCLRMLARFQRISILDRKRPAWQSSMILKWLFSVSIFVLLVGVYYFIGGYLYFRNPTLERNIVSYFREVYAIGVVLTFLPSLVLAVPEILYGIPRRQLSQPLSQPPSDSGAKLTAIEPTLATPISEIHAAAPASTTEAADKDPFHDLGQRVLVLMERDKPYLQFDFSIEQLSEMLDVPKHHMYYCFKNVLKTKFVQFRTQYRVNEAKSRLLDEDLEQTTLYAIGRSCGFSSHTAFYRIFHERVGCSPGEYIERNRSKNGEGSQA